MSFGPKYRSPEICIFTVSFVNYAAPPAPQPAT